MGEACQLTVVHEDFQGETETFRQAAWGTNIILSALKTLLETGQPLVVRVPQSVS